MKLVCKFYPEDYKDLLLDIDKRINLIELVSSIEETIAQRDKIKYMPCVDLSKSYYDEKTDYGEYTLPYILNKNQIIEWNVPYHKITIEDLIRTFNSKNILKFDILIGIGGIEQFVESLLKIWDIFINVVTPIILVTDTINAFKNIKNFMVKKKCKPQYFIIYIYSKNSWNLDELSKQTEIEKENLKSILKGFGFRWDRESLKYVKTDKSEEIYIKLADDYKDTNL